MYYLFIVAILLVTGGLAARKGYSFFFWCFAAGLIGLITLAFLPYTNKGDLEPEVAEAKRKRGNTIGMVISIIAIIFAIIRFSL